MIQRVQHNLFRHALIAAAFFIFLNTSCRSTKISAERTQILNDGLEINALDNSFKIYNTNLEDSLKEDETFIFLRLYWTVYKSALAPGNLLKGLIVAVEPNPILLTHASIGFSLDDSFYGLTSYSPQDLKLESCTDTSFNGFMNTCDRYHSTQLTLALKVTEEEKARAKKILEQDFMTGVPQYKPLRNWTIGWQNVRRCKEKTRSRRKLGGIPCKKGYVDPGIPQENFVCSSYVAYVLANSVQSIQDFFTEKQIDYNFVLPTDLAYLPGEQRLFSSNWIDYNIAAGEFVLSEPYFKKYINAQ